MPHNVGRASRRRRAWMTMVLSKELVEKLDGLRTRFGRRARDRKLGSLRDAARRPLDDARLIRAYHETLLFLVAYPDDARVRRLAEAELGRVAKAGRPW